MSTDVRLTHDTMPLIADNRILLRAPEPDDVDALFLWENDLGMAEPSVSGAPVSRLQVWNYVQGYNADPLTAGELRLIIADRATDSRLGHIDLVEIDRRHARAGVAIYIAPAHRGTGTGTDAVNLMTKHALTELGLHQLWARVAADNAPSLAMFQKCGYRPAGRLRSWIKRRGRWVDAIMLQRLGPW